MLLIIWNRRSLKLRTDMTIYIIKFIITLLSLSLIFILPAMSSNMFSDDSSCAAEDAAITNIFSQIFQCLNANQNLTQHILMLNERLHYLQMKLEETEKKLDLHINEPHQQLIVPRSPTIDHIVIQRRQDGSVDFYRTWNDYKQGFGNSIGEFFIGLDQLHKLTNSGPYALLIVMEDWENERRYAKYDRFVIGSESEKYKLKELGAYSGTAGNSLAIHLHQKFSTKDQENDRNEREHCAVWYTGAWWYNACHESNLNGRYLRGIVTGKEVAQGIHWNTFRGQEYSLKFVEMSLYLTGF